MGRESFPSQLDVVAGLADLARQAKYKSEVGAFYWTVPAPNIVNPGREGQGSISL
jgi:hypothetical protein